jgi:HPt (histidine-containing phosphotransfer) domain-containing protein
LASASPRLRAILSRFVQSLPEQLAAQENDWRGHQIEALAAKLHRLQGTSGNCGFPALAEAAAQLESEIRDRGRETVVARLQERMRREVARTLALWREWLPEPAPEAATETIDHPLPPTGTGARPAASEL